MQMISKWSDRNIIVKYNKLVFMAVAPSHSSYTPITMLLVPSLLWFVVGNYQLPSTISFKLTSTALGQSYYASTNDVNLQKVHPHTAWLSGTPYRDHLTEPFTITVPLHCKYTGTIPAMGSTNERWRYIVFWLVLYKYQLPVSTVGFIYWV